MTPPDPGCIKTVTGESWPNHFIQSLKFDEYKEKESYKKTIII